MEAMQGRFTVPNPTTSPRACVVCAQPLDWRVAPKPRKAAASTLSAALYPLCPDLACRMVFDQDEALSDADFGRNLQWRAKVWRQEQVRMRQRWNQAQAEARQAAAMFDALSRAPPGPAPDLRLVVASGHAPSRRLSARRRRAYAGHLDEIIAAATAEPPAQAAPIQPASTPDAGAAAPSLPGRLCGVCGGGCCVSGRDAAYLSEATMRRVMAAHPGLDAAQLRALYLERLAPRTLLGSCINHTRDGCALPASLRSDVCNAYACAALKRLQQTLEADPPARTVMVLRRRRNEWSQPDPGVDNPIVAAAVLTEVATTPLRLPKADAETAPTDRAPPLSPPAPG